MGPHTLLCRSEPPGLGSWALLLGESAGQGLFLEEGDGTRLFSCYNGDGHTQQTLTRFSLSSEHFEKSLETFSKDRT